MAREPAMAAAAAYRASRTRPSAGASSVLGSCPLIAAAAAPGRNRLTSPRADEIASQQALDEQ